MTHHYRKVLGVVSWATIMLALMFSLQPASLVSLAVFTFLIVGPAAAMWHFWNEPPQTLSQSIQSELK
jgi:hypothetical protein